MQQDAVGWLSLGPLAEDVEPTAYLKECITALTNYLVNDVRDRDLVGLRIHNTGNVQDKVEGINFRRPNQLKSDVVWVCWGMLFRLFRSLADTTDSKFNWTMSGFLLEMVVRRRKGDA
jgi:hypothetical protein